MRWEIKRQEESQPGDIRYKTRFAWLPTRVLSKITMTDHMIWLEVYIEEQEYQRVIDFDLPTAFEDRWVTVSKTIHI
jgi:hypothetical protein